MEQILKIIDEECALLNLKLVDGKEIKLYPGFENHIAFEILQFFRLSLINSKQEQKINLLQYGSGNDIILSTKDHKLFANNIEVLGKLIDLAKQIVKDIEIDIEDWALNYYGNLLNNEERNKKEYWYAIFQCDILTELNLLKSVIDNNGKDEYKLPEKGYRFIKALNKRRLNIISEHIWSLNFKKERPVQIVYDETISEISAKLTSARYLIAVRPDTTLEEIDKLLLEKGYIIK